MPNIPRGSSFSANANTNLVTRKLFQWSLCKAVQSILSQIYDPPTSKPKMATMPFVTLLNFAMAIYIYYGGELPANPQHLTE